MELAVSVHPRICRRNPEISADDVLDAWENCLRSSHRSGGEFEDYVAIGIDKKGRIIEMVATQKPDNSWLIYHAFTPPTKKVLQELGLIERSDK